MPSVVVVGTQWGDEGKGKITDFLAQTQKLLPVIKGETMQVIPSSSTAKSSNFTSFHQGFSFLKKFPLSGMVSLLTQNL